MVTTFTNKPSLVSCTQFRVIVVTDPPTHTHTHTHTERQDQLQYTVPQLVHSVNIYINTKKLKLTSEFELGVGGDDFTTVLHVLQLQLSPQLPSSLAPIKPTNPVSPGKWPLNGDRERE